MHICVKSLSLLKFIFHSQSISQKFTHGNIINCYSLCHIRLLRWYFALMLHERHWTSFLLQAKLTNTRTQNSLIRTKVVVLNHIPVTSNGNIVILHVQTLYAVALLIGNNTFLITGFINTSEKQQDVLKFNDICVSWNSPKTENVSFSQ